MKWRAQITTDTLVRVVDPEFERRMKLAARRATVLYGYCFRSST